MSGRNNCKCENFKQKHAEKRRIKEEKLPDSVEYLTVQRLTAEVEGKCQKYGRIGPLSIVPFSYESLTLENIKNVCKKHFDIGSYMECDVLAGERGPSYTSIEQIKSFKLLHVRFYFASKTSNVNLLDQEDEVDYFTATDSKSKEQTKECSAPVQKSPKKVTTKSAYPKSVPLSSLLKLGKIIPPKCNQDIIELYVEEFSIEKKEWAAPIPVKSSVDQKSFACGAVRDDFEAQALSGLNGRYVLKRYKQDQIAAIVALFGSVDNHTRKCVQMHSLARYYAMQLEKEALSHADYGRTLQYSKVYVGKTEGDLVTWESYMEGEFVKYINNDGHICKKGSEVADKAEAFSHFTYVKSEKQLMVLDIQGTGYSLYDPEIASTKILDDDQKAVLFCFGNLSTEAIEQFLSEHRCKKYCSLVGINSA